MTAASLAEPPVAATEAGARRRIGVELEMGGIALVTAAEATAAALGLRAEAAGAYAMRLCGDAAGPWQVEVDSLVLKGMGARRREGRAGRLERAAELGMRRLVGSLIPVEVTSPPLPLARFGEMERVVRRLREAGARGSSERLLNAYGLQLNPEAPSLRPEAVAELLRAFFCLYPWLYARAEVDPSRRVVSFIDSFPPPYLRRVVDPSYRPDLPGLIDDYLRWSPTRNRVLDLLPLLTHLDAERVRRGVPDRRIKPRPAYHYRLPNCEIHRPGWGIAASWNDWVEVERLAADRQRLTACAAAYGRAIERGGRSDWIREVEARWLGR